MHGTTTTTQTKNKEYFAKEEATSKGIALPHATVDQRTGVRQLGGNVKHYAPAFLGRYQKIQGGL